MTTRHPARAARPENVDFHASAADAERRSTSAGRTSRSACGALRDVPAGETTTYAEVARAIGAPRAVRAVAGACAANALAVAVPCHRVIREDGDLTGYRWGVARKRALLAREAGQ